MTTIQQQQAAKAFAAYWLAQDGYEKGKVVPLEFEPLPEAEQQEYPKEDSGLFSFFKKLFS